MELNADLPLLIHSKIFARKGKRLLFEWQSEFITTPFPEHQIS